MTPYASASLNLPHERALGFVWLYYYVGVLGNGGVEVFLAFAPFWIFPYLVVISVYVGFFAARFAKGRWKHAWLWGIAGFALTLLFIMGFPILLSPVFPYQVLPYSQVLRYLHS